MVSGVPFKLDEAAEICRSILSSTLAVPLYLFAARCALGLLSVIQGDTQEAADQYEILKQAKRILVPFHLASDRLLGILSHILGNVDQAATHFDDSQAFCRRAGYRPELAWTCCDYTDTLLQRGEPGDREKAMSLLDESLAISTELGMRPLMERVLSRRDILKA